jgi:suppressor of G2 allele of SKP1
MAFFKEIFNNGDEEKRKAMIKSFQTSGGTVLSTDWTDVSKKDY